jgi:8-oxo-dGTP diphosphatase
MFLFTCRKNISALPAEISEGHFEFFAREEINGIEIPETDRTLLWPVWDKHRTSFLAYRAECDPSKALQVTEEESHLRPHLD